MSQVLAISAPRPCFRPKLGHDIPLIHSTDWSEQHLTQTSRDPELKHKLNFDVHTAAIRFVLDRDGAQHDVLHGAVLFF